MSEARSEVKRTFEFSSGNLCLDFINTVEDRPLEKRVDLLTTYTDLWNWAEQAHLVRDQQQCLRIAQREPQEAEAVLLQAIEVREALYHIFFAVARHEQPENTDLAIMNEALAEAMSYASLLPQGEEFTWVWPDLGERLDSLLWPVLRSAADLLTSDLRHTTRVCAADDCLWLFLDTSKNHSRRWCNMNSCGNRAKARRFSERKKLNR